MWLWEGLVFVAFIIWALGAGLLSTTRKVDRPEKHQIQPQTQETPATNDIEKGDVAVAINLLISAIKTEGRANRREERREDYDAKLREQITIVFIGITMFAIILQVHEMVKAYEPIHDQAKAAAGQAVAAVKQADAAVIQAQGVKDQTEAAKQAAISSRESSVAAGRAWVGPSGAAMNSPPTIQQDSKIVITYQNTGREPAVSFVMTSDVFTVALDQASLSEGSDRVTENLNKCHNLAPYPGSQVVFPSSGFGGNQANLTLGKEKIDDDVIKGNKYIVAVGCFAYETFQTIHRSAFCFLYRKDVTQIPNLNYCPGGAYAD